MITNAIETAKEALLKHEVIAIPTETVYGLAGNAYSETAVRKIFLLKKRPFYNPLIIHIKSKSSLHEVAQNIPDAALKLAETFWPGPLTLVLDKKPHISTLVTAGKKTVAIRVPNHPITLTLLRDLDFPLAAPSANPFGSLSPTTTYHVAKYFKETLGIILEGGACEKGVESTIVGFDGEQPILLRYGSISPTDIEQVIGKLKIKVHKQNNPDAPGMLSRHYAPDTNIYLTDNVAHLVKTFEPKKIGLLLYNHEFQNSKDSIQEILSQQGDLKEASKNLYAALHRLDNENLDVIIAEKFPNTGLGKTINDRLERATKK